MDANERPKRRSGAITRFGLRLDGKDGFGGHIVRNADGKRVRVSATTLDQLLHPRRTRVGESRKTAVEAPRSNADDNADDQTLRDLQAYLGAGWEVYDLTALPEAMVVRRQRKNISKDDGLSIAASTEG